jgi:GT2 family glycosyltransferase
MAPVTAPAPIDVSIILINWRLKHDVESVLGSLERHRHRASVEVLLINKPSGDGTEELIAERHPEVRLISHPHFGFATMRNVGLREARGRYCLILDTDVEILPHCIDAMVRFMDRHPRIGGAGGHTVRLDGQIEYNVKRFYDLSTVVVRRSPLERLWPDNPWNRRHLMMDKSHERPFLGDWMAGAFFCMRREAVQQIGGFDEGMHYFEDVDWCWRAKRAGWRIAFNPYARIIHKVARRSGGGFNKNTLIHLKSGIRFWWKTRQQGLDWAFPERPEGRQQLRSKPRADAVDLTVIVVNYNASNLLRDCLASLRTSAPGITQQVIVVDNASADDSCAMVRREFPEVQLIANEQNAGFTRANNQGIAVARGRYIMLLNNDTRVLGDAFTRAVRHLDDHPEIGAAGLKLLNDDGSLQLSCRRFPSFSQALFNRYSLLTRLFPNNRFSRAYLMSDIQRDAIQDVDWVSGACLLVRREVLDEIGALDERFFMYCEDVDFCYRVWLAGWRVTYLPFAEVVHLIGQSSRRARYRTVIERHKSMFRFYAKHYSRHLMFLDFLTGTMVALRCGGQLAAAWWARTLAGDRS